ATAWPVRRTPGRGRRQHPLCRRRTCLLLHRLFEGPLMNTASEIPAKPLPRLDGPEAPFWEGLREGEIRVQHCSACGRPRFPASRYCPKCHSGEFDWKPVTTEGEIESFCVFHKAYFPGF